MSPVALYQEIQAQSRNSEIAPTFIYAKRPKLTAEWVKENGKLICKWHVS